MVKRTLQSGSVLLPNVGMSQSGLMVAALVGGFIVYLGMNGKLAAYWALMTGGGGSSTAASATAGAVAGTKSATGTTSATAAPSNTSLGLPASLGQYFGLGGTGASSTPVGGVSSTTAANAGAAVGVPNTSLSTFFGLGG